MCARAHACVHDVSTVCVEPPLHKVGLNIMRVSDRETLSSLFQGLYCVSYMHSSLCYGSKALYVSRAHI